MQKAHDVAAVAERVSVEEAKRIAWGRVETVSVGATMASQEANRVASLKKERELRSDLYVAMNSPMGGETKVHSMAGWAAVLMADAEVKKLEVAAPASTEVDIVSECKGDKGIVMKRVLVVVRQNEPLVESGLRC